TGRYRYEESAMTACDVVGLISAAALWVVLTAYHKEVWQLPRVGPWLFIAALLTSAHVMVSQMLGGTMARHLCPAPLLIGAQASAVVALWLAFWSAPPNALRKDVSEAVDE
ncbi:MAG: hypothetical protein N2512_11085, partial [Armatimonadetes bacterium]|nr:hypothetical protein [Armatimonadota bacterium]